MSKRFSTLDTTRLLFEHPKILFRMIERMDRNEARYIRESDLVAEVMDYTRTLGNADRDRVRLALNTDNLFRSGLVIDIIKAEGERRLVFQDVLINLIFTLGEPALEGVDSWIYCALCTHPFHGWKRVSPSVCLVSAH